MDHCERREGTLTLPVFVRWLLVAAAFFLIFTKSKVYDIHWHGPDVPAECLRLT